MIVFTTVTTVTAVTTVKKIKKSFLSQYFLEEQFDTFDNRCDVLKTAFCDSRNVFCFGCSLVLLFVCHAGMMTVSASS